VQIMSVPSPARGESKASAASFFNGRLSQALTSALDGPLLRPLIDIIAGYARSAVDWTRATVEILPMAVQPDPPAFWSTAFGVA
jgi:hypothetical protein